MTKYYDGLLDVETWSEGCLRLRGWTFTALMVLLTGGLMALYELQLQNVEDIDFRDMLFDHRVTSAGNRYHHQHFINAEHCCRYNAAGQPVGCSEQSHRPDAAGPQCPRLVTYSCSNLQTSACAQLHSSLLEAAGSSASGQLQDCYLAGRVRFRAQQEPGLGPQLKVLVEGTSQQLDLDGDPSSWMEGAISSLVAEAHIDSSTILPSQRLSQLVQLGGSTASLSAQWEAARPAVRSFGWPSQLWPWNKQEPCPNTETPPRMHLEGAVRITLSASTGSTLPQLVTGSFDEDIFQVPAFRVQEAAVPEGNWTISALTRLQLSVGYLPATGACGAWQLDPQSLQPSYGLPLWSGPASEVPAAAVGGLAQEVQLVVRDVAEPKVLALPDYRGEVYVYLAVAMGGVFALMAAPLLAATVLIYVNVRRNQGQPTIFYMYMKRYRGW